MASPEPARHTRHLVNGVKQTEGNDAAITERAEVRELASLFKRGLRTLADHYAVGVLMRRLSEDAALAAHGSGWRVKVAAASGASAAGLNKCLQFRRLYREDEVAPL